MLVALVTFHIIVAVSPAVISFGLAVKATITGADVFGDDVAGLIVLGIHARVMSIRGIKKMIFFIIPISSLILWCLSIKLPKLEVNHYERSRRYHAD